MKENWIPLSHLDVGKICIVMQVKTSEYLKQRLLDLGITEQAILQVLFKSPAGDPVAYYIRGAVIALRKEISNDILVEAFPYDDYE